MDHICAITGSLADDEATVTETGPLGWIKITIERQIPNPEYVQLQQLKTSLVEQNLASVADQIPEGNEQAAQMIRLNVELQVRAMFSALENDMDEYVPQYEEAYISAPEIDEDVFEVLRSIRESLGLMDNVEEVEEDEPTADEPNEASED
jgi:hypothetical protein